MPAVDFNNNIYYSISNGKICRQYASPVEGSVPRVNKNGRQVHEVFHSALAGKITNISTRDNEYGKFWNIELNGNEYLQFPYSSGYADSFLKTLPNVDFESDVLLIPKIDIIGDKQRGTLFINQHGKGLKRHYTKETPNGIPELKKIKIKGKDQWDSSDILEFLENMVNTTILPKLKKADPVAVEADGEDDSAPF